MFSLLIKKVNSPRAGGKKSKTGKADCQSEFMNGIQGMRGFKSKISRRKSSSK